MARPAPFGSISDVELANAVLQGSPLTITLVPIAGPPAPSPAAHTLGILEMFSRAYDPVAMTLAVVLV